MGEVRVQVSDRWSLVKAPGGRVWRVWDAQARSRRGADAPGRPVGAKVGTFAAVVDELARRAWAAMRPFPFPSPEDRELVCELRTVAEAGDEGGAVERLLAWAAGKAAAGAAVAEVSG